LFKSPGAVKANKFRAALAALAAQKAIIRWKAKMAAKKKNAGGFGFGKKAAGVGASTGVSGSTGVGGSTVPTMPAEEAAKVSLFGKPGAGGAGGPARQNPADKKNHHVAFEDGEGERIFLVKMAG
jgi:hypothetical protein